MKQTPLCMKLRDKPGKLRKSNFLTMHKKLKLLDLFCGAGGCSMGYFRAGFIVHGIDLQEQRNYPFRFFKSDWLSFLEKNFSFYDVIHASPPCQHYSVTKSLHNWVYPDLIEKVRASLIETGKPYVIENVPGSPLLNAITLRGNMFDLKVKRDRLFESNLPLVAPPLIKMTGTTGSLWSSDRSEPNQRNPSLARGECDYITVAGKSFLVKEGRLAMRIKWMNQKELAQAIPPAYTEYLGKQILEIIKK